MKRELLLIGILLGGAGTPAFAANSAATVFIRVVGSIHAEIDELGLRQSADLDQVEITTGSGFVISPIGHVLTNAHVVRTGTLVQTSGLMKTTITVKSARVEVCFPGSDAGSSLVGKSPCLEGVVHSTDTDLDLAVVFVNATGLATLRLGDADAASPGQPVTALGFPLGRHIEIGRPRTVTDFVPELTSTAATVSALRSDEDGRRRYLQISGSLNAGNSGGPLVDRDGYVIGVVQARKGSGIGYAIPINQVADFLEARGLAQWLPGPRLRLGDVQSIAPKGVAMRMLEGFGDASPFRSRVETDPAADIVLRVDRVSSSWTLRRLEEALLTSRIFEPAPLEASAGGSKLVTPTVLAGEATSPEVEGAAFRAMSYALVDLGHEKIVARYVGPATQVAFNRSVLRQSLASLEAQPIGAARAVGPWRWASTTSADGTSLGPLPSGWLVEPGAPSECDGLPRPTAAAAVLAPDDFGVLLRLAIWNGGFAVSEAAARCGRRPGSIGDGSYASTAEWLGTTFLQEGVFVASPSGEMRRLEVVVPVERAPYARELLSAWAQQARQGVAP